MQRGLRTKFQRAQRNGCRLLALVCARTRGTEVPAAVALLIFRRSCGRDQARSAASGFGRERRPALVYAWRQALEGSALPDRISAVVMIASMILIWSSWP